MWESSPGAAGSDIHHKEMVCTYMAGCVVLLCSPLSSHLLPSVRTQQGIKNFFPDRGPPPPAREHWDLATVASTSATEKERECNLKIGYGLLMKSDMQTAKNVGYVWYPAPHLHTICTMDSCHFPGLKQNPSSASSTSFKVWNFLAESCSLVSPQMETFLILTPQLVSSKCWACSQPQSHTAEDKP